MRKKRNLYNDPLVSSFFKDPINRSLLKRKLEQADKWASEQLDKRFAHYHLKARLIHYTAKLARYYSKEYDKKYRARFKQLMLNVSTSEESTEQVIDQIPSQLPDTGDLIISKVEELLPTPEMKKYYNTLSEPKKKILHLYTFNNLSNKEIAMILKCTPQNVSKLKKQALQELRGAKKNGSN
ncbi:putative RNA polymerase sigma-70, region 4 [Niallia circulans]|nr:putative RNA polymerase sigma-70, region 4 [Niallia circulans]